VLDIATIKEKQDSAELSHKQVLEHQVLVPVSCSSYINENIKNNINVAK
jgi:hypothetical protein